jgi:squalene-associated FAD-dependent desaturase
MAIAARSGQTAPQPSDLDSRVLPVPLKRRTVHVVGAGLAGLSAAVDLASRGVRVAVHEAAPQAGGRCRSYLDAALGMEIDNGNHLVLSGNGATLAYLDRVGARGRLAPSSSASFPFVDLATGERWTVRANEGPIPWWIFDPRRRVPGARLREYLALARLLRPRAGATIGEMMACSGPLYDRLIEPFLTSALNIAAPEGSAALAASVIRETLAAGGRHYHPLIARDGLSAAFVDPALGYIEARGGSVTFGRRLRGLTLDAFRATALDFADAAIALTPDDGVILAVPPQAAGALVPGLSTPTQFRAIVNAHYRIEPPAGLAAMTGVVNGLAQWLFAFPGRLSVTISAADHWLDTPREELAVRIWRDVAAIAEIAAPMPAWQIVRERRATFAASPGEEAKRPAAATPWSNLALAGDWTRTGLPATIEGAIRSGAKAAERIAPL